MKSKAFIIPALLMLALSAVMVSCDKDKDLPPPVLERSFMHIQNVSELTDSFDITFDYWNVDDVVISNFYWNRNWPMSGYANLLEGGQPDEFGNGKLWVTATQQLFVAGDKDTLAGPMELVLDPGVRQSFYMADSAGKMFFLVLQDEFSDAAGVSNLRFVNLRAGSPVVSIRSTDGSITLPATNFGTASSFITVPMGNYDFEAVDGAGTVIATATGVLLWEKGAHTITLSKVSPTLSWWNY